MVCVASGEQCAVTRDYPVLACRCARSFVQRNLISYDAKLQERQNKKKGRKKRKNVISGVKKDGQGESHTQDLKADKVKST